MSGADAIHSLGRMMSNLNIFNNVFIFFIFDFWIFNLIVIVV